MASAIILRCLNFFSILCLILIIGESKLQVPFQDYATPAPAISSKIYYLQDSCSICEMFRPDFTKIPKPPAVNETKNATKEEKITLKRVARSSSAMKKDEPERILLDYDKDSTVDDDKNENGVWSWRKAYKRIKAKWVEKYENNTVKEIENKMTAKLKIEKTQDGDQEKKMVLEFKKKIGNLTSLNYGDEGKNNEVNKEKPKDRVIVKRELKQIFLDPIKQPSIVIRSKRSTKNEKQNETTLAEEKKSLEKNNNLKYEKCRLLIRFKNDSIASFNKTKDLKINDTRELNKTTNLNEASKNENVIKIDEISKVDQTTKMNKTLKTINMSDVEFSSESSRDNNKTKKMEKALNTNKTKDIDETLKTNKTQQLDKTSQTVANETIAKTEIESKNTDFGLMINIQKFVHSIISTVESDYNKTQTKLEKQNPFFKNFRIFTSDPNMTEYWYQGKKVDHFQSKNETLTRTKRSAKDPFIDMIDMEDIIQLLTQNGTDLDIVNEKWILLERKIFFDDPDSDDDEEMIINLFLKPKEEEKESEPTMKKNERTNLMYSYNKHYCPKGTFDCNLNDTLCIPNSLRCNGENNCGNGNDEINCGPMVNLFYVYNENQDPDSLMILDSSAQGMFWLGTRILFILFAISLFLYILLLLCRMCDRLRNESTPMFIIPKGNYISISGDTIERKTSPKSGVGSNMDTHGSKIREYIYVNNNYGQPQGSTVVSTDIQRPFKRNKPRNNRFDSTTTNSPDVTDDEYPPLYEESIRHYGIKK